MEIGNRLLFLRYAIPCARTLVERGWMKQAALDRLIMQVSAGTAPKEDYSRVFLVAYSNLKLMALSAGKKAIDEQVIRDYFLDKHDDVVPERFGEMGDFDPLACIVYPGKIEKVSVNSCTVSTPAGTREYKSVLIGKPAVGQHVCVHHDYIVERISGELAKSLWQRKAGLAKSLKDLKNKSKPVL